MSLWAGFRAIFRPIELPPRERGEAVARENGVPFLETSAKTNVNVERAFADISQRPSSIRGRTSRSQRGQRATGPNADAGNKYTIRLRISPTISVPRTRTAFGSRLRNRSTMKERQRLKDPTDYVME